MRGIIWSQDGGCWDHGQSFSLDKTALQIWFRLPQTSFSYTANPRCSSKPIYRIPGLLVFSECTNKWPFYWSQHSLTKCVVNLTEAQHVVNPEACLFSFVSCCVSNEHKLKDVCFYSLTANLWFPTSIFYHYTTLGPSSDVFERWC